MFRIHRLTATTLFLLLLGSLPSSLHGQEFVEKLTRIFEFEVGKNRHLHEQDTTLFVNKMVLAPIIRYEPSTNLGLGVGAKLLFKPKGVSAATRTSNLPLSITYTLNNQFIFFSGYTVFFNEEKYLLKGNLIFSKFPIKYFGLGATTVEDNAFDIAYDNFLVEPLLLRKVGNDGLFIGGGFRYNTYWNTEYHEDVNDIPAGTSLQDSIGSTSAGVELAITYDNRDNVLNAVDGKFMEFTHGLYGKVAGGTHRFMLSKLDYRQYIKPFATREDIIAYQLFARFSWNDTPVLERSALGGGELMRGFQEGRFRDKYALFAQAEYRWQALERLGLVFFGGIGQVSNDFDDWQLGELKYSMGSGIRLKIIKSENLNIRFDYGIGFGPETERHFYLGIAEAF